jgi:hypothetical protein
MFVSILWIAPQAGMAQTAAMQAQTRAIKWLLEHQNPVGSWGDERREVLTTAVALKALRDAGVSAPQLRRAEAFLLEKRPSGNADLALAVNALRESALPLDESRMLTDLTQRSGYSIGIGSGNPSYTPIGFGFPSWLHAIPAYPTLRGWGGRASEQTALADSGAPIESVALSGLAASTVAGEARNTLTDARIDGAGQDSWPLAVRPVSEALAPWTAPALEITGVVFSTARALLAIQAVPAGQRTAAESNALVDGSAWLRAQARADGGFGDSAKSSVEETSLAYRALRATGTPASDSVLTSALSTYLVPRQISLATDPDRGSWNRDAYQTAMALSALVASGLTLDTDGDGTADAIDTNDDGDGAADSVDAFPLDSTQTADLDLDGLGDGIDVDLDGDGFCNAAQVPAATRIFALDGERRLWTGTRAVTADETTTVFQGTGSLKVTSSGDPYPNVPFGVYPSDRTITGDWDGDGLTDPGIARVVGNGWQFHLRRGGAIDIRSFGGSTNPATEYPITGDWDGDGITEVGVARLLSGTLTFFLDKDTGAEQFGFGITGDVPVTGDWDGNGTTDVGIYRRNASVSQFHLRTLPTTTIYNFGPTGTTPAVTAITGDWDGDRRSEVGVAYVSSQLQFDLRLRSGSTETHFFGSNVVGAGADVPLTGDWDQDGITEPGLARPSGSAWLFFQNHEKSAVLAVRPLDHERWTDSSVVLDVFVPQATYDAFPTSGALGVRLGSTSGLANNWRSLRVDKAALTPNAWQTLTIPANSSTLARESRGLLQLDDITAIGLEFSVNNINGLRDVYFDNVRVLPSTSNGVAGVCVGSDAYPSDKLAHSNTDGDSLADPFDDDIDGDGFLNLVDLFPFQFSEWEDLDRDGIGDSVDSDDDGDGIADAIDNCPPPRGKCAWSIKNFTKNTHAESASVLSSTNRIAYLRPLTPGTDTEVFEHQIAPDGGILLTNDSVEQTSLRISGENATWLAGYSGGEPELFLSRAGVPPTLPITNNTETEEQPDLSSSFILWQSAQGTASEIYSYDLSAGAPVPVRLTNNTVEDRDPRIGGDIGAWLRRGTPDLDVTLRDLRTGVVVVPDNNTQDETLLAVDRQSGAYVGWCVPSTSTPGDPLRNCSLYRVADGNITTFATNARVGAIAIFGTYVVWRDDAPPGRLMLYNRATGAAAVQIPSSEGVGLQPVISATHVAWENGENPRNVSIHEIATNKTTQLSAHFSDLAVGPEGLAPSLIGSSVTWVGWDEINSRTDVFLARRNPPHCDDGLDNDLDGATDFPADPQCASLTDPSETNEVDADTDGVYDQMDNCTNTANINQVDADGDGYGNACDADFNNTGATTTGDFITWSECNNRSAGTPGGPVDDPLCAESDMNGSGLVNTGDFSLYQAEAAAPATPGPSGLPCASPSAVNCFTP